MLGIKGRIAFEAPAAELLLAAHKRAGEARANVEDQRFWKDQLGEVYGKRLHQGMLHDPFLRNLEAFFASSQAPVTGVVRVLLTHGRVLVEGAESPYSLMSASDAAYGERPAADATPEGVAQLARIMAEPARLARRAAEAAEASEAVKKTANTKDGTTTSGLLRESTSTSLLLEEVAQ